MPVAEFKILFDNQNASEEVLGRIETVRVDQAMGMATEAELDLPIGLDEAGVWQDLDAAYVQPYTRVRVEVKIREGDYTALIDGPIVAQRFEFSAAPNDSKIVLTVQDDSVLLNQQEVVTVFEDQSADQIASSLFSEFGLEADVDAVDFSSGVLGSVLVQRGTAMQCLKKLARQNDAYVHIEPGSSPGVSVGRFKKLAFPESSYPELLLIGAQRNTNRFTAHYDALRPMHVRADGVDAATLDINTLAADQSNLDLLGDESSHAITQPASVFLKHAREPNDGFATEVQSAVNESSWAFTAQAEVIADSFEGVLAPYKTINVAGAGAQLSGPWLILQVTHTLNDEGYRQNFQLRRNARSQGGAGGLLGSVF